MKRRLIPWVIALTLVAVAGLIVLRGTRARSAPPPDAAATRSATLELLDVDVITAQARALPRTLPVTGTIKALNVAQLKAKVPGVVQELRVRTGEPVRRGQLIARIDPSDYEARVAQARSNLQAAQAQVDIAQRSVDNNRSLVDQGFISKTALDTSRNNLEAARATANAARSALDLAQRALADTAVVSPIDGTLSVRAVDPGEKVGQDARIAEVVDLSALELEAPVPADDVAQVAVGQPASVTPEGLSTPVDATVSRIAPSTQGSSRSVMVYLRLQPKGVTLRQGMFAHGVVQTGMLVEMPMLPLSAVRVDEPQPYVWRVDGGTLHRQTVRLGARTQWQDDTVVQIVQGVPPGARVVRGGITSLQEGVSVKMVGSR